MVTSDRRVRPACAISETLSNTTPAESAPLSTSTEHDAKTIPAPLRSVYGKPQETRRSELASYLSPHLVEASTRVGDRDHPVPQRPPRGHVAALLRGHGAHPFSGTSLHHRSRCHLCVQQPLNAAATHFVSPGSPPPFDIRIDVDARHEQQVVERPHIGMGHGARPWSGRWLINGVSRPRLCSRVSRSAARCRPVFMPGAR